MKLLSKYILILALFFSTQLSAKSSIYENLAYFFQDAEADRPMIKVYEQNIERFVQELRKFDQKSKKKRIDLIRNAIEKKFFKVYKNEADLAGFFVSGLHNEISARAIQAIILEELGIPFQLSENGQGLQLIAYPKVEKIALSYDQKDSFLPWTEETQTAAVNYLIDLEVTTMSQANNYGYGLIPKHFNTSANISLQELAGLDLMKKGILAIGSAEYLKAVELLKIGNENYSDQRFGYLRFGAMTFGIDDLTYDNILIMDYMLHLYDLTRKRAALDRFRSNLSHVYSVALNERRDFVFTDSAKSLVAANLNRVADQKVILSSFLMSEMYYYSNKGNEKKSFECATQGLEFNPNNLEIQNVFGSLLIQNLFYETDWNYDDLEATELMDTLDHYMTIYPFLEESDDIKTFFILIKSEQVSEAFNNNLLEEGLVFVGELEELLKDYDFEDDYLNEEIALTYSDISTSYYRDKKYNIAMEWAEKAVKLFPDSEWINSRKKNVEAKL